jgi:hypothetical protein
VVVGLAADAAVAVVAVARQKLPAPAKRIRSFLERRNDFKVRRKSQQPPAHPEPKLRRKLLEAN